jgi:hypothetical protein
MSKYNNPTSNAQPVAKRPTAGRPQKGRKAWNLSIAPAIRKGIEAAARAQDQSPSDFLNAHFAYLATVNQAQQAAE